MQTCRNSGDTLSCPSAGGAVARSSVAPPLEQLEGYLLPASLSRGLYPGFCPSQASPSILEPPRFPAPHTRHPVASRLVATQFPQGTPPTEPLLAYTIWLATVPQPSWVT